MNNVRKYFHTELKANYGIHSPIASIPTHLDIHVRGTLKHTLVSVALHECLNTRVKEITHVTYLPLNKWTGLHSLYKMHTRTLVIVMRVVIPTVASVWNPTHMYIAWYKNVGLCILKLVSCCYSNPKWVFEKKARYIGGPTEITIWWNCPLAPEARYILWADWRKPFITLGVRSS